MEPIALPQLDCSWADIPDGKGAMAIMGLDGDTKHTWDPNNPAEVEAARATFDVLVGTKKYRAYRLSASDDTRGEQLNTFDPRAGRILFVPPMQGG